LVSSSSWLNGSGKVKLLDCVLNIKPVIVHKPCHDENRLSRTSATHVIGCNPPWHAVDVRTNDQQIGPQLVQAINCLAHFFRAVAA
jgi:hypothetical protein